MTEQQEHEDQAVQQGERLQKILAQAGVGSRREMEAWIVAGRVTLNGEVATLGMRAVEGDVVGADKRVIHVKGEAEQAAPRVLLYHKQEGEIVSRDDPESRKTVFEKLPKLRGQKWIAIGRLDFNTSGLLIFTTSGELANRLMHPRFEVEREYAVRVQGVMTEEQMRQMVKEGLELEDGLVKFDKLSDEGGEGFNHWYRLVLKEGRNRVVRRTFEALGLTVSRLMRVRFGIVNLPPSIKRGKMAELGTGEVEMILDWVGMPMPQPVQGGMSVLKKTQRGLKPVSAELSGEATEKPISAEMPPLNTKPKGRRGQSDMSRSRAHRKIKSSKN
jgi:23S rRNA pseudouridine2605 synthase